MTTNRKNIVERHQDFCLFSISLLFLSRNALDRYAKEMDK